MHAFEIYRVLIVLLPAVYLAWVFVCRRDSARVWTGSFLAYAWQFQIRLALLAAGFTLGMIEYKPVSPGSNALLFYNVPVDVVIGTSLLFGPVVAAKFGRFSPFWFAALDFGWSLLWLPLIWTAGSVGYIALCTIVAVVPSLYLARWTVADTHIYLRATLQPVIWAMTLFWLIPSMLFTSVGADWSVLWSRPWHITLLWLIPLLVPGALLVNALYEFAVRGKGTAFPYDPPKYLVTTGVYRYVSNPMQISIVLLMLGWGAFLKSPYVMGTGAVAIMLFIVFKDVCNGSCRIGVTDPQWQRYQQQVRRWWPRFGN